MTIVVCPGCEFPAYRHEEPDEDGVWRLVIGCDGLHGGCGGTFDPSQS